MVRPSIVEVIYAGISDAQQLARQQLAARSPSPELASIALEKGI